MLSAAVLDWPDWVAECLEPAISIASDMPYHQEYEEDNDFEADAEEEDEEDRQDRAPVDEEDDQEEEEEEDEEDENDVEEQQEEQEQLDYLPRGALAHPIFRPHRHGLHNNQEQQQQQQQQQRQQQRLGISPSIVCVSCKETYTPRRAGTCRECYEEASETEEVLRKEIEDLNARIAFLKSWAPEAMGEDCTDLVLESSDGSKIRAHRAVLVSRSSVFKAMLENEMEESRSGTIKITDFSYEVLRLFVHYLYTAEIYPESLDECAFDLLALAEKYNVKQLKSVCERYMISKVNNDNALFSYEYASQHGAKTLKEAALSAILENIHELPKKDDYRDLVNRDAKLIVEIFESFLVKQTIGSS